MAQQVWVLNLTGNTLTLPYGTTVGLPVQQMDPSSLDYQIGVANGQIVQISATQADNYLAVTKTQLVGINNTVQTPLTVAATRQIYSVSYSSFTSNGTVWLSPKGVFTKTAKSRVLTVYNQMDQPITAVKLGVFDQAVGSTNTNWTDTSTTVPNANQSVYSSQQYPQIAGNVDSLMIGLAMGATAPTQNQVVIYVTEAF